jgi:hypothetical protein
MRTSHTRKSNPEKEIQQSMSVSGAAAAVVNDAGELSTSVRITMHHVRCVCDIASCAAHWKKKPFFLLTTSLWRGCALLHLLRVARMSAELLFLIVQYLRHATPLRDASE